MVGRHCCAAWFDGRAAARPYRLEWMPIIIGKWYQNKLFAMIPMTVNGP
jgi:hypothetical protein